MMRLISFDGHSLDGQNVPFYAYFSPEFDGYTASIRRRARHRRAPVRTSLEVDPKERIIRCFPKESGDNISTQAFHAQISRIFTPYRGERWLVAAWDDGPRDDSTTIMVRALVDVISVELQSDESFIDITVEASDPHWQSFNLNDETDTDIDVGGNVETWPVLSIEGGDSITRRRVSVRDRTGRGIGSELVSISWSQPASQTLLYVSGLSQPFLVTGGRLWFRIDAGPGETVPVDVYNGSAINNTDTADALDDAGINLASSTMTSLRYQSWRVQTHPLSATNSWRPGRIVKHPNGRPYSFGLTDPQNCEFSLVDRVAAGRRWDLPDNYDSVVMLSNTGMNSLNGLELDIFAGYDVQFQSTIERHNIHFPRNNATSGSVVFSVGDVEATLSAPFTHNNIAGKMMDVYRTLFGEANIRPGSFLAVQLSANGRMGVRITFQGDLERVTVPIPMIRSNSLQTTGGSHPFVSPIQIIRHDETNPQSLIEEAPGALINTDDEFSPGKITAFVAVADHDEQDWREIWSRDVIGRFYEGRWVNESLDSLDLHGAHRVAVGLRASSDQVDSINYGRLIVGGTPTLSKSSGQTPQVTVSGAIPARIRDGTIRNLTTGERIILNRRITDDVPLVIDCEQRTAQSESGPEYTLGTERSNPSRWISLQPAMTNEIEIESNWTLTTQWRDRWEL